LSQKKQKTVFGTAMDIDEQLSQIWQDLRKLQKLSKESSLFSTSGD
jgi:hypothetical protein